MIKKCVATPRNIFNEITLNLRNGNSAVDTRENDEIRVPGVFILLVLLSMLEYHHSSQVKIKNYRNIVFFFKKMERMMKYLGQKEKKAVTVYSNYQYFTSERKRKEKRQIESFGHIIRRGYEGELCGTVVGRRVSILSEPPTNNYYYVQ